MIIISEYYSSQFYVLFLGIFISITAYIILNYTYNTNLLLMALSIIVSILFINIIVLFIFILLECSSLFIVFNIVQSNTALMSCRRAIIYLLFIGMMSNYINILGIYIHNYKLILLATALKLPIFPFELWLPDVHGALSSSSLSDIVDSLIIPIT